MIPAWHYYPQRTYFYKLGIVDDAVSRAFVGAGGYEETCCIFQDSQKPVIKICLEKVSELASLQLGLPLKQLVLGIKSLKKDFKGHNKPSGHSAQCINFPSPTTLKDSLLPVIRA